MIIDDCIAKKPSSGKNGIVCRHYGHAYGCTVKSVNFRSCLYHAAEISSSVGFAVIAKLDFGHQDA